MSRNESYVSNIEREMSVDELSSVYEIPAKATLPPPRKLFADIEEKRVCLDKIKKRITKLDEDYRSKSDPLRRELYLGLKRFFRIYPGNYRKLLHDMPEDRYANFLEPKPGLLKSWDSKDKVQKVLRYLEFQNMDNRSMLYSTIGSLNTVCKFMLMNAAKLPERQQWSTFRLLDPMSSIGSISQLSQRDFGSVVKNNISKALETLEDASEELEGETLDLFYVHRKAEKGLVYIGVRKQISLNPNFVAKRSRQSNAQRRTRKLTTIEKSQTLTIVTKQNFAHVFLSGSIGMDEKLVMEILVDSLGYKGCEIQNLEGKDLMQLIEICSKPYAVPSYEDVEAEFCAKEKEMATKSIVFGSRTLDLNRHQQVALFLGGPTSSSTALLSDLEKKNSKAQTICFTSGQEKLTTTIRSTGSQATFDNYIVDLFNNGYITDLTPFINLKKQKANRCSLETPEEL